MSPTERTDPAAPARPDEARVAEAVEEYLALARAGRRPPRAEYLARHPELAPDLAECLDGLDFVRSAADDLGRPPGDPVPVGEGPEFGVLGDFRIVREVGRGGMGVVYEAEQISLRRRVALKVLPFAAVMDPRHLQRFHNEALAAASLDHPHVVKVHGVGQDRGVHFIAMQFVDGRTLADLIRERRAGPGPAPTVVAQDATRTLAPDDTAGPPVGGPAGGTTSRTPADAAYVKRVAGWGVQAAEALEHAHGLGVVHRDVKPGNLLVDGRGTLYVADFGLAKIAADPGVTGTGDLLGTLRYMSPEQAAAKHGLVDHRSDVYSLGVTLYELLTLAPAFGGESRADILRRIADTDPTPPRRVDGRIPRDLETVVLKAMARDTAARYPSARDLADDLKRFIEHKPILAKPPGRVDRARKWVRRNRPLVASLAAALGLLLAGSAAGAIAYIAKQRDLANEQAALAADSERARQETATELYRALLRQSSALRLAREPGYRKEVWKNLHQAAALDTPVKNLDDIRDEVLACLNDPVGLEPVPAPDMRPASRPAMPEGFRGLVPPGHLGAVTAAMDLLARVSQDQTSNADDKRVEIIDRDGRRVATAISPIGFLSDLAFSPDGRVLIGGGEFGVVIWDVPALTPQAVLRGTSHSSIAVHPGGHLLGTLSQAGVELWTLNSNRLVAALPRPTGVAKVGFSADGELLVALSGDDRPLVGWPVAGTPEQRHLPGHLGGVPSIASSPDGTVLASAGKDRVTRLWDVRSGALLRTLDHPGLVQSLDSLRNSRG